MRLRSTSLAELRLERDTLEADMAEHAARLAARQTPAEDYAPALRPQAERLGAIRAKILLETPTRELWARYRLLQQQAREPLVRTYSEQYALDSELRDLDLHFSNPRRRPLTLKTLLVLMAVVAAMLYGPQWVGELLSP
ncbi:hypothetical protein KQ945_13120 [Bacillus subtilis subsp. subtilis]|nr:hypothetical protein [Bacillus subtilis subsp. subtilis]